MVLHFHFFCSSGLEHLTFPSLRCLYITYKLLHCRRTFIFSPLLPYQSWSLRASQVYLRVDNCNIKGPTTQWRVLLILAPHLLHYVRWVTLHSLQRTVPVPLCGGPIDAKASDLSLAQSPKFLSSVHFDSSLLTKPSFSLGPLAKRLLTNSRTYNNYPQCICQDNPS